MSTQPKEKPRTKTLFMLMAEFDGAPAVELKRCYHYLGYDTAAHAERDACERGLEVPCFRSRNSQKSKRMVHLEDLAKHIDRYAEAARDEFNKIHGRAA
ncbi:pyocin activator PrtN family protein [Marinobacterium lutimaris]|uniref:Pyocin activator protein PrtN n=1 Tax=Marinobacterium lutimaris TaxID=568106 RepID=A0A1H5XWR7_9GAMM|nr:pyocin activator PrtN family protein [Marinobacterium lutimaris]SEG16092.1 Pyocin activator protein PrtN [Marinobacterium lutimaris]